MPPLFDLVLGTVQTDSDLFVALLSRSAHAECFPNSFFRAETISSFFRPPDRGGFLSSEVEGKVFSNLWAFELRITVAETSSLEESACGELNRVESHEVLGSDTNHSRIKIVGTTQRRTHRLRARFRSVQCQGLSQLPDLGLEEVHVLTQS